jgi:hypothetical protein
MIKEIFLFIKCKIVGHSYVPGGSCPFTGKTYNICSKCEYTVAI